MGKKFKLPFALLVYFVATTSLFAQTREIIVYGQNAPDWNQKLGVTATRGTCAKTPAECLQTVQALLREQHTTRFYLNMIADPNTVVNYASQYSKISVEEPRLYEITFDDFPDHFNMWCRTPNVNCEPLLRDVIKSTRSQNPHLRFGITIYADQIPGLLSNHSFTQDLRNQIDSVHLYVHYSGDGPEFETYVKEIKRSFPKASVIAGAYAYDRIDYRPCSEARPGSCSPETELDLYKQTLKIQKRLLEQGEVKAIEFYPGFFGWEEKYNGWNDAKQCRPERRQACIDNTKAMHQLTLQTLIAK